MIKAGDKVRFVNFELEERPFVRKFMEDNRERTFVVKSVWSEYEFLVLLEDSIEKYFQDHCLTVYKDVESTTQQEVKMDKQNDSNIFLSFARDYAKAVNSSYYGKPCLKAGDEVRFVNFELEERLEVRKFMDANRARTFTVERLWPGNEHLVFLDDHRNYFQGRCLAKPRFKVGDKVRTSLSNIPYVVTGISSNVIGGRIHYNVRHAYGTVEKVVSEYDLVLIERVFEHGSKLEVSAKKDAESTLTQVDVRDGERLVAILYLRPWELHLVIPMLTESYDNVSFRRVDEPPF